jgi:hypothetical protein
MVLSRNRLTLVAGAVLAISTLAFAVEAGPPLVNWTAPATYAPGGKHVLSGEIGTGPMPFYPITPCRQFDSRSTTVLSSGVDRTIQVTGAPCGIPSGILAVSMNITVFNITGAGGNGTLKLGTAAAPTTSWINYPATETQRANAGAVPLSAGGAIVVQAAQGGGTLDIIVDVNGYYLAGPVSMPAGHSLTINGNFAGNPVIHGINANGGSNSTGVLGTAAGTGPGGVGVWGQQNGSGFGVYGFAPGGTGLVGQSNTGIGVVAVTGQPANGGTALLASNTGGGGAFTFGIKGSTSSQGFDAAGIKGVGGFGDPLGDTLDCSACGNSGVRGVNDQGYGTLGISRSQGAAGIVLHLSGTTQGAAGYLGFFGGGSTYYGVFAFGDYGGTGAKYFVEPDPADATKVIRYIALEGPEAGTYFRGTARFQRGRAVIEVPESFRMVTAVEGVTVQLTAIGAPAALYIESQDLTSIVVRSNKDVAFHYQVNGVRHGYENFQSVAESEIYRPARPDAKMSPGLTEAEKASLISNGTYRPDGTVNMETARALQWDKAWEEAARPAAPMKAAMEPGQPQ